LKIRRAITIGILLCLVLVAASAHRASGRPASANRTQTSVLRPIPWWFATLGIPRNSASRIVARSIPQATPSPAPVSTRSTDNAAGQARVRSSSRRPSPTPGVGENDDIQVKALPAVPELWPTATTSAEATPTPSSLTSTAPPSTTSLPTATAAPTATRLPSAVYRAASRGGCVYLGLQTIPVKAPRPALHPEAAISFQEVRAEVLARTGIDALASLADVLRAPTYETTKAGVDSLSWHKAGRAIDLDTGGPFRRVPEQVVKGSSRYQFYRVFVNDVDLTAIFLAHGWDRIPRQGAVEEWWHFEYHPDSVDWAVAMRQVWPVAELTQTWPDVPWKGCPRGVRPRLLRTPTSTATAIATATRTASATLTALPTSTSTAVPTPVPTDPPEPTATATSQVLPLTPLPQAAPPEDTAAPPAPTEVAVPSPTVVQEPPAVTDTALPVETAPVVEPTVEPTAVPTPTAEPTAVPTPTAEPTAVPTPTAEPTAPPTPTAEPTAPPTPTAEPTPEPTPTAEPTAIPTPTSEPLALPEPDETAAPAAIAGDETTPPSAETAAPSE